MFFVADVSMPVASCVLEASEQTPYISMSLYLDMGITGEQAAKTPPPPPANFGDVLPGAMMLEMGMRLMNVFLRLAKLLEMPDEIPVMGDILLREAYYRVLQSPAGAILRGYNIADSQGNHILAAINWLRKNLRQPLLVETLAKKAHMAPSTFHTYFKKVTTLSPLQYQKRLRLDGCLVRDARIRGLPKKSDTKVSPSLSGSTKSFLATPHRNIVPLKNEMR